MGPLFSAGSATASTSGTNTSPAARSQAKLTASVVNIRGGGAAWVLAKTRRPPASSTRYAMATSPPWIRVLGEERGVEGRLQRAPQCRLHRPAP